MKPVIVLVGRPNVGKSTLFNRLTGTRDALVADEPGLTRDSIYGVGSYDGFEFIAVDTGGIVGVPDGEANSINDIVSRQSLQTINEADIVCFLVDGRAGLHPLDEAIVSLIRRHSERIILVVNKTEGVEADTVGAEFFSLGLGDPYPISATRGGGIRKLMAEFSRRFPNKEEESERDKLPHITVVGRPNVGKSTLVNSLLGENRVLVYDQPGTTRDSVYIDLEYKGTSYVLVDTAGVRRKSRVTEKIENLSIVKTLQAIDRANIVILIIDGSDNVTKQDLSLMGHILDQGRALVLAVNKWDTLNREQKGSVKDELDRRFGFLRYLKFHYISALKGTGIKALMVSVSRAYASATASVSTSRVNALLKEAVEKTAPPMVKGRRIKIKYGHQGGKNPPTFVIHGNQVSAVPKHYQRYLANFLQKKLSLEGTPLRIEFRDASNPYRR